MCLALVHFRKKSLSSRVYSQVKKRDRKLLLMIQGYKVAYDHVSTCVAQLVTLSLSGPEKGDFRWTLVGERSQGAEST